MSFEGLTFIACHVATRILLYRPDRSCFDTSFHVSHCHFDRCYGAGHPIIYLVRRNAFAITVSTLVGYAPFRKILFFSDAKL